jgi:hypothetical protein
MPAGLLKNQRQEIGADQVGLPTLPQCISVAIVDADHKRKRESKDHSCYRQAGSLLSDTMQRERKHYRE